VELDVEPVSARALLLVREQAFLVLRWTAAIACAAVAWTCAHVALALWIASTRGATGALVVAALLHALAALLAAGRLASHVHVRTPQAHIEQEQG
jgi:steroid 5-alpha reductase family enzyme